ncbi:MAG: hypothetical protein A2201_06545 [Alicyclobacillus sp. RIFOXYA1_FULL_53_8]|nr:MAG: hypothetical protein A2201_06545 [Alicyclobacillus sp. RIFOXYA1_FULL_53_8]
MQNYVFNNSFLTPLSTVDASVEAANNGIFYTISTGLQLVSSASGFLVFQLTNPANSGKTLQLRSVRTGSFNSTIIDIFRNSTFTGGTSIIPRNTNYSFTDASIATAKYLASNTDPTTGGTLLQTVQQANGSATFDYDGRVIIPGSAANQTFYVRLTNSGTTTNMATTVSWWEY